jgi:hypothetical protein
MKILLLLSGDAKNKWINTHNDVMPNNGNPTEVQFHAVWTAFIINYGASNKTAKGLQDFLQKAKKPVNMKLYKSMTFLNTMENFKQQEAKRKPKTCCQDNSKLQQQQARNQNQCCQGNQNHHNEESFCSYHQFCRHSDAECHNPHNPKEVNANNTCHNDWRIATVTATTNKITTTETTKTIKNQPTTQLLLSDSMLSAAKGRNPPTTGSF